MEENTIWIDPDAIFDDIRSDCEECGTVDELFWCERRGIAVCGQCDDDNL